MKPRKTPCASCPYRRDVPSGIWAASDYVKLYAYDGSTSDQAINGGMRVFQCHQSPGKDVCAGWAAVAGNYDCLALRLASSLDPNVDVPAVLHYTTDVPLFGSGAEAAQHGMRDIYHPSWTAIEARAKIIRVREMLDQPVEWD